MKPEYTTRFDNTLGCDVYSFQQVINCQVRNSSAEPTPKPKKKDKKKAEVQDDPVADDILKDGEVDNAKWTTEYVDSLPDSSFAVIEKGYDPKAEGKSDKNARHLEYKDANGKIDIPHLKAAWDRRNQITSVLKTESDEELRDRAEEVLEPVYKKYVTKGKEPDAAEDKTDTKQDNLRFEQSVASEPVRQSWRLISAVQAWPNSGFFYPQLVDYAHQDGEVLKDAVDLINAGKVDLIWNHSSDAHDVAGHVENASWEDSSDIPRGVNAELVVNPKYDAKAAIGLQSGILRNGSIGVLMDCKPSHSKMAFDDFIQNQGETVDGDLVRWIPVKLTEVRHMAIVPAGTGADPHAGRRLANSRVDNSNSKKVKVGGKVMSEESTALLNGVSQGLGIEVALTEDGPLPEGFAEKLLKKIEKLNIQVNSFAERYNENNNKIEMLAEMLGVEVKDLEVTLRKTVALAAHGEKLLEHYRKDAAKWFDSAKVALGHADLTDTEKRMRTRIENSDDLDYLEDISSEYKTITEANLSSQRVSEGVDLLNKAEAPTVDEDRQAQDIRDSARRVHKAK